MFIKQLYTGCLAEAAYYIESNGEAAVIDPLRETEPYLALAEERGATIKYIFETHFHADFVSGHLDLAQKTGATIVYGPTAKTGYPVHEAVDGEEFNLGGIRFKVLHTPGHTLESSCFLLLDEAGKEHAVFTGDTLFIGDVGRPDLAVKADVTVKDLAGMLYDSLRAKLMPLPDAVKVYPAHGAGSACGKNISNETESTIGAQKATNYAMRDVSRDQFITELTTGIMPAPQYFAKNAMLNKQGVGSVDGVMERGQQGLSVAQAKEAIANGALVLDTRHENDFEQAFVPGSVFIGLDGSFAVWVGTVITDLQQPIVLVVEPGRAEEALRRLARVGYDQTVGYLEGGVAAWQAAGEPVETLKSIEANELETLHAQGQLNLLDVRKPGEYEGGHVAEATSFPLDFLNQRVDTLDADTTYHLHCKSGYRSVIASSLLKRQGLHNLVNVHGGYEAIVQTSLPQAEPAVA